MASEAWTRKEGKSPSGGLNAKGRASYTKGTLKAPSKKKGNKRRKSFCKQNAQELKDKEILIQELINH